GMCGGHAGGGGGNFDAGAAMFADGCARFRDLGERWGLIVCLSGQAEVAMARGQPAEAVRLLEKARDYADEGVANNWSEMLRIPLARARAQAGGLHGARAC